MHPEERKNQGADKSADNAWYAPIYDPNEQLVDVETVAAFFKVSPRTIHRWIFEEHLPCYRIGGTLRFQMSDIKEWLEQHRVASKKTRRKEASKKTLPKVASKKTRRKEAD